MFKIYEKYLEVIDEYLKNCFDSQRPFIHCKSGCTECCETGEYPFSRLEMEYLMNGFPSLPPEIQKEVRENIKKLLKEKAVHKGRFLHMCPFLIDRKCVLYKRRGITCRTFGLAYFETINGKKVIKLPECSKNGLNYSQIFCAKTIDIDNFKKYGAEGPIPHSLNLNYFEKELLKGFTSLEFGEIRPLLDWFIKL